jgi:hypothetical protein
MNARVLGIVCASLAAMPILVGCESSRSQDYQFEKQVKRAQECRRLQDKLIGDQPLTPQRGEEIVNTMAGAGCTSRLPSADAGIPPRFPVQTCDEHCLKTAAERAGDPDLRRAAAVPAGPI